MTSCGTTVHTDPDDYCVSVPGVAVDLVLTNGLPFKARVAWIKLRLAFLSLDPSRPALPSSAEGAIRWGAISISARELGAWGRTLVDKLLMPPPTTRFLRAAKPTTTEMLRLHARACRLAGIRPTSWRIVKSRRQWNRS